MSRSGNRRINHPLHMMAVTQIRYPGTDGRRYYERSTPRARPPKKRSAASSGSCQTRSTGSSSATGRAESKGADHLRPSRRCRLHLPHRRTAQPRPHQRPRHPAQRRPGVRRPRLERRPPRRHRNPRRQHPAHAGSSRQPAAGAGRPCRPPDPLEAGSRGLTREYYIAVLPPSVATKTQVTARIVFSSPTGRFHLGEESDQEALRTANDKLTVALDPDSGTWTASVG